VNAAAVPGERRTAATLKNGDFAAKSKKIAKKQLFLDIA